jgi:hypothetical protein
LFFSDAVCRKTSEDARTSVVTRTSMDRATNTVRHERLFSTEVTDRGSSDKAGGARSEFQGQIRGWHAAGAVTQGGDGEFPFEYELLVAGLLHLGRLGGDKSIGRGRCTVPPDRLAIRWKAPDGEPVDISPQDALANFSFGVGDDGWLTLMNSYRGES